MKKQKKAEVHYEKEWLQKDGLIRPLDYCNEDHNESVDSDFERDSEDEDSIIDQNAINMMQPIPLQR